MDRLTIHAEARPESWDGSGLTDHAEQVSLHIKNTIGITAPVMSRRARHAGALARQGQARPRQEAEGVGSVIPGRATREPGIH